MDTKIDTINYRGYTIEIHVDLDPLNPFDEFGDTEPPLLVCDGNRRGRITAYGHDEILEAGPLLGEAVVRKHWRDMLALMGEGWSGSTWRDLRRFVENRQIVPGEVAAGLEDEFADWLLQESGVDELEAIAEAYRWTGVEAVVRSVSGHCQGDFAQVLAVALPEWANRVGAPTETHESQLKNAIKLFEAWAFGSVYGYIIKDPDRHEINDGLCWGFYGMDHEESDLLKEAKSDIDADIPERARRKETEQKARQKARIDHPTIDVPDYAPVNIDKDGTAHVSATIRVPLPD